MLSLLMGLFFLPFISMAKGRPVIEKPITPPKYQSIEPAFKAPGLQVETSECSSACQAEAEPHLERVAVNKINLEFANAESTNILGGTLKTIPVLSASLQGKGLSSGETKAINSAFIAANILATKENWEPEVKGNILEVARASALDPVANREKLEEIKENCLL